MTTQSDSFASSTHQTKTQWIQLGNHIDSWGKPIPVGLPLKDMLLHTGISGTTGSGKSALLRNIALQAFAHQANVVVIEPHGDLILDAQEGILSALPASVLDRVTDGWEAVRAASDKSRQRSATDAGRASGHDRRRTGARQRRLPFLAG